MVEKIRMYSKRDIEEALEEAGRHLEKPVDAFLIGGCAMTFRNLKPATKDADLLLVGELEEKRLFDAMLAAGFTELFPGSEYVPLKAKDILLAKNGLQFDLFAGRVMGGLRLSSAMKSRAVLHKEYGKLRLYLASKEDVYLFKAVTDRPFPRDYEDLLTLQQSGLDWKAVILEYEKQIKGGGLEAYLRKKLSELKKGGIINPLMRELKI